MDDIDDGDFDLVAAQYVIGTLDHVERVAFADRLPTDGVARRAVAAWERRLSVLSESVDSIPPSPDVWTRIERAIQSSGFDIMSARVEMADGPVARPFDLIEGGAFLATPRLKASRNRWRAAALLSGSIAAALLLFIGQRALVTAEPTAEDISYVAAVNRGGDKPALIVRVDLKTRQVFVRPVAAETPAGHSLELWYIGDNTSPRSMGVVDQVPLTMKIPQGASATKATFAVTVEQPGGSKTGAPQGPIVYSGALIKE